MRRHVWVAECLEGKGNAFASPTSGKVLALLKNTTPPPTFGSFGQTFNRE